MEDEVALQSPTSVEDALKSLRKADFEYRSLLSKLQQIQKAIGPVKDELNEAQKLFDICVDNMKEGSPHGTLWDKPLG